MASTLTPTDAGGPIPDAAVPNPPNRWSIIYEDLTVLRGVGEQEFAAARSDGVQFIVFDNREAQYDHAYYIFRLGVAEQSNEAMPLLKLSGVKFGSTVRDETFEAARQIAKKEAANYGWG